MVPAILILLVLLLWPCVGDAQTSFYQGKTLRLVAGTPAGSVYDLYARMVAQFIGKYIPGNPNVIVQNMPGVASMVAANYIYTVAKPDGLTIGSIQPALYFNQLVGRKEVQFNWQKFTWLGNTTVSHLLLYMRGDTPYKTIDDIRQAAVPPKCGAEGTASSAYYLPRLLEHGATYYVRTDGTNTNYGTNDTAAGTWRNIWYASTQVSAGDTVNVKAGTYNEFITNTVNGSAGSPITFNGERSGSDWGTIIAPSTDLSTGWVTASEIGSYVWKQTNSFEVRYMTIDGRRAAWFTSLGDMTSQINSCYVSSGMTSGSNLLAAASDKTVTLQFGGGTITFWDGIKAAFCSDGMVCYLRFADNSEPNGKNIRVAPNSPAAVGLSGRSYITWRNFKVIGAYEGFSLSSTANNNIIESIYVSGTTTRVMRSARPAGSPACIISSLLSGISSASLTWPPTLPRTSSSSLKAGLSSIGARTGI